MDGQETASPGRFCKRETIFKQIKSVNDMPYHLVVIIVLEEDSAGHCEANDKLIILMTLIHSLSLASHEC